MSAAPEKRRLQVDQTGDITIVHFNDRQILNEASAQEVGQELHELVDGQGRRKIVVNFANVEYLCSMSLGKFIGFQKKLQTAGGKLVLCNLDDQVAELFAISKGLFKIVADEQAAAEVLKVK